MHQNIINLFMVFIVLGIYLARTSFVSKKTYFNFEKGKRIVNTESVLSNEIVASKGACTTKCNMQQDCCAASFDTADGMCRFTQNCRPKLESSPSSVVIKLNSGECRRSAVGYDYLGRINVTVNNRQCQRWDVDTPHIKNIDMTLYTAGSAEENYCRNPDLSARPWCYTVDPNVRFEYCDIPFCEGPPKECLESSKGVEYFGHIRQSNTGRVCQRWDVQVGPYSPSYEEILYLDDQENYCRNPYGLRDKPWCYVGSGLEWEYCDIPIC